MSRATINKQLNIRNNGNPFVGQSDLAVEHWDKDILGIGSPYTYSGASGENWSNAYGTDNCKDSCKGLFALSSEKHLQDACKKTCEYECNRKSKCPDSFSPTRESVCLKAGLDKNCQEVTSWTSDAPPPPNDDGSGGVTGDEVVTGAGGEGMSTGSKLGITLGILAVLGTVGYFIFRKK
jgi:hypothetical protein